MPPSSTARSSDTPTLVQHAPAALQHGLDDQMVCRYLVQEARALGREVIDRCNLTVLLEPGQEHLAQFLADNQVRHACMCHPVCTENAFRLCDSSSSRCDSSRDSVL